MSEHDDALIKKAERALADFALCDPYPEGACPEEPCPQCAREASALARAVLDAVADDYSAIWLTAVTHAEARAEQAEAKLLDAAMAWAEDHARLTTRAEQAEAERDAYRKAKQENDERFQLAALDAEAALSRVLDVHAEYFDLDREPFDDASPEPEDVWRYDRDFRAATAKHRQPAEDRSHGTSSAETGAGAGDAPGGGEGA